MFESGAGSGSDRGRWASETPSCCLARKATVETRAATHATPTLRIGIGPSRSGRQSDHDGKPFHYPEVAARIAAVLRRSRERSARGLLRVGELSIDPVSRDVTLGDRKVELSAKEFALLRVIAAEPTRMFTKEELLRNVWGFKLMGSILLP